MEADDLTIPLLLRERSRAASDVHAIVYDDSRLTYAELDARSRQIARRLVASGIGPQDRVGLLLENGIDWAVLAYGILRVGAVLVPLSTLLRPPELIAQLRQAGVTHLISTPSYRGRDFLRELEAIVPEVAPTDEAHEVRSTDLPSLQRVCSADALPTSLAPEEIVEALEADVRPSNDLAILFTSGSRGAPKGVLHTHGNGIRAVASGLEARCIGRHERLYIPMPFFWTGGFCGGLLTTLVAEATLLGESDPSPATTLAFLERERITLFRGWPDQAARIAADPAFATTDLSSLQNGSLPALLPESRRPRPGARANLFGMTETFGPYSGSPADQDLPDGKQGSCGRPFDGVEVRILDVESNTPVSVGEQGEIAVRGPNVMKGIVRRLREDTFTPDGFYCTGDLGILDEDGFLFYKGRADDMFKVSGATVYPSEVEAALRSIPSVAQAFVTNVLDDETNRDIVGAAVLCQSEDSLADLDRLARERLSAFKVPKRWLRLVSLDEVPMMATGKVDKAGLQDLIRSSGKPS